MLTKVLTFSALIVAAQAGYSISSDGSQKSCAKPSAAGYAAQIQPAVTLTVLPAYGGSSASAYGSSSAYGSASAYQVSQASQSYANSAPSYQASKASQAYSSSSSPDIDAEILNLLKLVFALPSAGGPDAALINVPQYPSTVYTAPAVELSSDNYNNAISSSSAAAAAANIKSATSGYGPAPAPAPIQYAGSGYGSIPVASQSAY